MAQNHIEERSRDPDDDRLLRALKDCMLLNKVTMKLSLAICALLASSAAAFAPASSEVSRIFA